MTAGTFQNHYRWCRMRYRFVDVVAALALLLGVSVAVQTRVEVARLRAEADEQRAALLRADEQVRRWSRAVEAVTRATGVTVREDWDDGLPQYEPEAP